MLADFEAIEHHITRVADLLDEAIRDPNPKNRAQLENIGRMLNYLTDRANAVAATLGQDEGPVQ